MVGCYLVFHLWVVTLTREYAAFGKTIDEESKQVVLEVSKVETGNLGGGFTDFPYDLIGVETIRLIEE